MVGTVEEAVERDLVGGRLACPDCEGVLRPWGYGEERVLRRRDGEEVRWRPRRAICRYGCGRTHVLLWDCCLIRRRDDAERIVTALQRRAQGWGYRRIATELGMRDFVWTVRGWLRAFASAAVVLRAHFTRWAYALDADLAPIEPRGSPVADAVEAMGVAVRAAVQRFGPLPVWARVARMSGGALLCKENTIIPLPPPE
jgi:hypothetical protein